MEMTTLPKDCVLIAGGGPIGMVTAKVLAFHGIKSIILERNNTTTKWPKMDLTNARSMEIFRILGLADGLREQGVATNEPTNAIFSTGLNGGRVLSAWDLPSVDDYCQQILTTNDGTQPREPYQRISQTIFEAWMRERIDEDPLVDLRFGWRVETVRETANVVEVEAIEESSGRGHLLKARYMVACDGASSKTRRSLQIPLTGGPMPVQFLLVHFRSNDLARINAQGKFWHFFTLEPGKFDGSVISQNAKDVFTVHLPLALDADANKIGSEEAIYTALGGKNGPFEIKIDEVFVRSSWRPSIAVADTFVSEHLRVFLAGDSAHQNPPTGGYGMNTGIGDAFAIGWQLAAVIDGWGRPGLLRAYNTERRPVSLTNVDHAGTHMNNQFAAFTILDKGAKEGVDMSAEVHRHYQENDGENKDLGIEMGYRYVSNLCIPDEADLAPDGCPPWNPHTYMPTTVPGSRPPHVFLTDGSSVFDHFGKNFTLVEFRDANDTVDRGSTLLVDAAACLGIPLTHTVFVDEAYVAKIWHQPLVLIRPDCHVAWRGPFVVSSSRAANIMQTVAGYHETLAHELLVTTTPNVRVGKPNGDFTGTENTVVQTEYVMQGIGDMQR
ncbi:FAD-binding domain-containing protein [Thozetella sp. PMI_491]|nr:FAD-binding domain-containing protein [Thozetella sp. PMI_491]